MNGYSTKTRYKITHWKKTTYFLRFDHILNVLFCFISSNILCIMTADYGRTAKTSNFRSCGGFIYSNMNCRPFES